MATFIKDFVSCFFFNDAALLKETAFLELLNSLLTLDIKWENVKMSKKNLISEFERSFILITNVTYLKIHYELSNFRSRM